ncbi:MoaD/ThiS family protein [Calderihabitans maritimus]|uniref:Sulfur transfer protein ThiS n=1 Tax=Calderihabitans maritimus TaxID=1246530 RepID=A0A1Z5HUQ6_9FIRM|nr:MoaD/ThiS family protein [Calderihabitans maritimus]GAW93269.1 sulfur transfer protein ThiS [Calderihabitans maritimus]
MKITVKLFATLRTGRFKVETREYNPGTTVGEVIKDLNIAEEEAALILVNGRHAQLDYQLSEGDTLSLFPPLGGG